MFYVQIWDWLRALSRWQLYILIMVEAACLLLFLIPSEVFSFIYNWQQLVGSFVGAAAPIGLFLWNQSQEKKKKHKEFLFLLEKSVVSAINNLSDVDRMLHGFLDSNFKRFIENLNDDQAAGRYSVGQAFIPLSASFVFDKELLRGTTDSTYLENLMMRAVSLSQELPVQLEDLNRQFERTLTLNTQIGILKLNSAAPHNQTLLENLLEFESFLTKQVLGHNVPVYLRVLAQFKIALEAMNTWGFKKWTNTFIFPDDFTPDQKVEKMDSFFKEKTNTYIDILQKQYFKSRLLKVGEKSPLTGI